ncbi:lipid-A-disaccharide synthase [Helicobacter enhydrae]|uniref:Lipid-A-disaccharide synthase n=1 Tax=Helicobacter enhydrae TaxID=222136 RepID=A0A1B1U3V2_9HELI|nr:lipid-A-disaccharide synthase [Helicobacter enhydrae]ANV97464.1 lipid-A-disaccharide synthase [Helicobacter enhydrae]
MKILVSALEASSNLHLNELRKHLDGVEFVGIYEFEDTQGIYTPKDFSVMGFVDVVKKLFFIRSVFKEMLELAMQADVVLLLDSSSFHIPLAKAIKKRNPSKRIIYYILPQVWAWKPWRIATIKRVFDELYGILPFEIGLYGGKAEYIGHPLLDELVLQKTAVQKEGSIVFMPGSRQGEIARIFPIMCEVAKAMPNEKKVLVIPPFFDSKDLDDFYGENIKHFELSFDSNKALYEAKFAFICSGTATLQSTIIGTPFVLCYKAKKIDEWIVRHLIKIDYIGLANILATSFMDEALHLELIQQDCEAPKLLQAYREMDAKEFFTKAQKIKQYLKSGSSANLAQRILAPQGSLKE